MILEDLINPSTKWFIYEDDKNKFSAINIDKAEILDGVIEKYANIKGKHLLIRKDYFYYDDNESTFWKNSYHIKNGIVLSKEEFNERYLKRIYERIENLLK